MGGFNSGLGSPDEHLDENALKAAAAQKQLTQQQSSTKPGSGKSGTDPLLPQSETGDQLSAPGQGTFQPQKPRQVSTLKNELVVRLLKDVKKGVASIFDLNALFRVNTQDTPEEQAKKKSLHQRFQNLTDEQQQVVQKQYQEDLQKKKLEQEEEERKKQEKAEQERQTLALPSSPKKGHVGLAGMSKKQKNQTLLQQQRQGLSGQGRKH